MQLRLCLFRPAEKPSVSSQTGIYSEKKKKNLNTCFFFLFLSFAVAASGSLCRRFEEGGAASRSITRRSWDVIFQATTKHKHTQTKDDTTGFSVFRLLFSHTHTQRNRRDAAAAPESLHFNLSEWGQCDFPQTQYYTW